MTPPATPSDPLPPDDAASADGPAEGAPHHSLTVVARTDTGLVRSTNQDSMFAGTRLLVVADGMGGHAAGDKASRLVVEAFTPLDADPPGQDLTTPLLHAMRAGNASIADMVDAHPELDGMGTTVTAMLFDGGRAALCHVGDSRAYLYRGGVLHQLTHDDTFVQSLVDDGRITEHQAHEHPQRNLLLRALTGLDLTPLLTEREIRPGDRYMLCSDGLSGVVDPESIADALAHPDPEIAADTLIQLALVCGAPDNVTTIVADVVATGADEPDAARPAHPGADDAATTNPIARLTREMPRVPLPPIPEEPAAAAERLADADLDDSDLEDDDLDDADLDDDDAADDIDDDDPDTTDGTGDAGDTDEDADDGSDHDATDTADAGADHAGAAASAAPHTPATKKPDRAPRKTDTRRAHWYRRGAFIVAAAIALAAVISVSTIWVRHQYYVSDQGNVVVVFRGVNGSLLGWSFATFEETSCAGATDCTPMKVSDLQPGAQNQVRSGIKATSLKDARTVVERLSDQLLPPCPVPTSASDSAGLGTDTYDAPASAGGTSTLEATPTTTEPGASAAATPAPSPTTTRTPESTPRAPEPADIGAPGVGAASLAALGRASAENAAAPRQAELARAADRASAPRTHTTGDETRSAATTPASAATPGGESRADHASASVFALEAAEAAHAAAAASAAATSDTVTATPLAPATETPGVTCRTVP